MDPLGGCGPSIWVLFGENVCENEELGPIGGVHLEPPPQIRQCCRTITLTTSGLIFNLLESTINQDVVNPVCNICVQLLPEIYYDKRKITNNNTGNIKLGKISFCVITTHRL